MIAICHKCGSSKQNPIHACPDCCAVPEKDDDIVLAFMLTDRFLEKDKLGAAAKMIRSGQRIEFPPAVKVAVQAALQGGRAQRFPQHQGIRANVWGMIAIIPVILFLILNLNPWLHFRWATYKDSVESYESFASMFPSSDRAIDANERIRILSESKVWHDADGSGRIESLRLYVRNYYKDGKHLDEANQQIASIADKRWEDLSKSESRVEIKKFINRFPETSKIAAAEARLIEIADKKWAAISESRSLIEIQNFLKLFPETTKSVNAESRIQSLFNDFDWVKEQDHLEHYRRFASRYPSHPNIDLIEKRIIDLEVKDIAAGNYGKLPKAQALNLGGASTKVEVENKTGYELTIRYSGPDSKKLVIPVAATRGVVLIPGPYQVAASVNAGNVTNYYGSDIMHGGTYSSSFFIETR